MDLFTRKINLLLIFLLLTSNISKLYSDEKNNFHAVSTYECIGLYFKSPESGQCNVQFRKTGASTWRDGYPLVHDPRDNEYRGSIVGLKPNTTYTIKINLNNKNYEVICKTKNDSLPIGKITYLDHSISSKPLMITESGWNDHPRWTKAVRPGQRILYTIDAIEYAEENWPWVDSVCVWAFRYPVQTRSYPDYYTLVANDFTPKPIYSELQAWARGWSLEPVE